MNKFKTLAITTAGSITKLTFNRPDKYNSLSLDFWEEFPQAIAAIDRAAATSVLIIEGEGKHFCAGMDLTVFDTLVDDSLELARSRLNLRERIAGFQQALTSVEKLRIPVIAAIQGACIGGGVAIASVCDMRYCSDDAFFSIEEINIGVACDIGTLQRLPYQISETNFREWVYTGDKLDAAKAADWGFVGNAYKNKQDLMVAVNTIAEKIASKSPLALHGCKESMNFDRHHSVQEGLDYISLWSSAMLHETDMLTAMKARKLNQQGVFLPLPPKP